MNLSNAEHILAKIIYEKYSVFLSLCFAKNCKLCMMMFQPHWYFNYARFKKVLFKSSFQRINLIKQIKKRKVFNKKFIIGNLSTVYSSFLLLVKTIISKFLNKWKIKIERSSFMRNKIFMSNYKWNIKVQLCYGSISIGLLYSIILRMSVFIYTQPASWRDARSTMDCRWFQRHRFCSKTSYKIIDSAYF